MSRKYTEAEVRAILAKAVQDGPSGPPSETGDLTLDEIKQIGAEVGIDPVSLERAARSVSPVQPDRRALLAGAPTAVTVERRVEGSLDSVQPNEILSVIRKEMGSPGRLSELTDLLEWRSEGELGQRVITLSSSDGGTAVDGMADLTQAAVITHLPATLLGIIGSAIGFMVSADAGNEIGMVLFIALLPMVLLATRTVFGRLARSEAGKLERAVEELATLVGESDPEGVSR